MASDTAEQIVEQVGGPGNITSLTHCATRLRFELKDAGVVDQSALEKIPGVLGAVPQSGDRYQVVIGGGVANTYADIMDLPSMAGAGNASASDADIKAAARSKGPRGKAAWLDAFFEYLSNSFRPLLGVLLGSSLIIAIAAILDALGIVPFQGVDRMEAAGATWVFWDSMWQSVLYFLPVMVAYNAAKALRVDPWIGGAIMAALFTPEFLSLKDAPTTVCTTNPTLGTEQCVATIFGLPMQLNNYGGQVFVPLIMVALLALLYKGLNRIFPENLQMVFVPFFCLLIMVPFTAFIIGPFGVWLGTTIGTYLALLNNTVPLLFAVLIPMLYPFLVPLGLHWPLNALMLANIDALGYDFIQGPMGCWNFACFGATAGVLVISSRARDNEVRQTAIGALAAGLLGGISEPSLYGIHLRYKRIYPRMLAGCAVGGVTIGVLGWMFTPVVTQAFAFTSLLTIPVFSPTWIYAISITAAFVVAMAAVIISDYRTPEQKADFEAELAAAGGHLTVAEQEAHAAAGKPVTPAAGATAAAAGVATLVATRLVEAPVSGKVVPIAEVNDKVFASKALGDGVGIIPTDGHVVAPVAGVLVTVPDTGHAFGIKTDDGVEVLVHVGIDTVQLEGKGFQLDVAKDQRVEAGDLLAKVDLDAIKEAGFDTTTMVVVVNTASLKKVTPMQAGDVKMGDSVIDVEP